MASFGNVRTSFGSMILRGSRSKRFGMIRDSQTQTDNFLCGKLFFLKDPEVVISLVIRQSLTMTTVNLSPFAVLRNPSGSLQRPMNGVGITHQCRERLTNLKLKMISSILKMKLISESAITFLTIFLMTACGRPNVLKAMETLEQQEESATKY